MKRTASHHRGIHAQISRRLIDAANRNPNARCAVCGKTLDQTGPNNDGRHRNGRPVGWVAGHIHRGQHGGPYRLECSWCSAREGAATSNPKREPKSPPWW